MSGFRTAGYAIAGAFAGVATAGAITIAQNIDSIFLCGPEFYKAATAESESFFACSDTIRQDTRNAALIITLSGLAGGLAGAGFARRSGTTPKP